MQQPIPKQIAEGASAPRGRVFYTLLVDGSNALFNSMYGDRTLSSLGIQIGGIFNFLLHIKVMLKKYNFRYVYVFWDGELSGQLRYNLCPDYKFNRGKSYNGPNESDYMQAVNAKIKSMQAYLFKKRPQNVEYNKEDDKRAKEELYFLQRDRLINLLDELYIRQCLCDYTEADDFIGYYVSHKKPTEKIVILSNDKDLTQLISNDVSVYLTYYHQFVSPKNYLKFLDCHYTNVKLVKMVCGDKSDNIRGIVGVGAKTLARYFPKILKETITLGELIEGSRHLNEQRIAEGKTPLGWADNIVNKVCSGCQGDKIYEINDKIIDLHNPLMTDEAKELIESMMYAPMDSEGRSIENLYNLVMEYDIDMLKNEESFSAFFSDFLEYIGREQKNLEVYS